MDTNFQYVSSSIAALAELLGVIYLTLQLIAIFWLRGSIPWVYRRWHGDQPAKAIVRAANKRKFQYKQGSKSISIRINITTLLTKSIARALLEIRGITRRWRNYWAE
jgi:hypothetical protein